MHKKDDAAVPGWDPEDYPRSVLSARTNVDIAEGRPGRWAAATAAELAALRKLPAAKVGLDRRRHHPADHQPRQGADPRARQGQADHASATSSPTTPPSRRG